MCEENNSDERLFVCCFCKTDWTPKVPNDYAEVSWAYVRSPFNFLKYRIKKHFYDKEARAISNRYHNYAPRLWPGVKPTTFVCEKCAGLIAMEFRNTRIGFFGFLLEYILGMG